PNRRIPRDEAGLSDREGGLIDSPGGTNSLTREIRIKLFFNASLFVLAMLVGQSDSLAQNKTCDRECLRGFMTQYLNAVVAHRPDMLPLANNIRFTENTASVKIGDSDLWK